MAIEYTKKEEIWNTWTHAGGAMMAGAVGIAFIIVVCLGHMDRMWAGIGVGLYLIGMMGSYLASTIYHALNEKSKWKNHLRKWDHAAIYWHIAGSYSPITLIAMRDYGYWGWMLFTFVWILLEGVFYITGAVFYSFNKKRYMHTVFHFCVLAGSICHIVAVWDILIRDIF